MLYAVRFYDKENVPAIRTQYLPDHFKWLEEHGDQVLVGGSLRVTAENPPVGALWIVEAESQAQVEELLKTDPFWVQGVREKYEVFLWMKAFRDKKVLV
jgi:uncharacterized protein YciI